MRPRVETGLRQIHVKVVAVVLAFDATLEFAMKTSLSLGALDPQNQSKVREFAVDSLNAIASFDPTPDVSEVIAGLNGESAPITVVELARKMQWEPDRLARALALGGRTSQLVLSRATDQTFVALPAYAPSV
jgi:hypothetical protein